MSSSNNLSSVQAFLLWGQEILLCTPVEHSSSFSLVGTRKPAVYSTLRQSSAFICAAALMCCGANASGYASAPTMTHIPAKNKLPDLDDGGTGFPPRDDGDSGGGGGNGFFFFGFPLFLGFLKDEESEGPYRDKRSR